jgi:anti-sigma B factor antagonist
VNLGKFSVERKDETATIHLRGEFDLSNVRDVEACAFELVGARVRELCLDVHEVTFMDSSMLNLLVNLRRRLQERRGEFRVEPNLQITKLLELSGLGSRSSGVVPHPGRGVAKPTSFPSVLERCKLRRVDDLRRQSDPAYLDRWQVRARRRCSAYGQRCDK